MIVVPSGADKADKHKEGKVTVPQELPILPLRGTVLYPELILPIMVGRKKSVKLIDDAMDRDRIIGVVTQKRSEIEDPKEGELHQFGVAALILRMIRELDGSQRVIVQGISRIRIHEFIQSKKPKDNFAEFLTKKYYASRKRTTKRNSYFIIFFLLLRFLVQIFFPINIILMHVNHFYIT